MAHEYAGDMIVGFGREGRRALDLIRPVLRDGVRLIPAFTPDESHPVPHVCVDADDRGPTWISLDGPEPLEDAPELALVLAGNADWMAGGACTVARHLRERGAFVLGLFPGDARATSWAASGTCGPFRGVDGTLMVLDLEDDAARHRRPAGVALALAAEAYLVQRAGPTLVNVNASDLRGLFDGRDGLAIVVGPAAEDHRRMAHRALAHRLWRYTDHRRRFFIHLLGAPSLTAQSEVIAACLRRRTREARCRQRRSHRRSCILGSRRDLSCAPPAASQRCIAP